MNKQRRKELQDALDHLELAANIVQDCRDAEQAAFDNLPESIQWSERGEAMEDCIAKMDEAIDAIDGAVSSTSDILE